MMICDSLQAEFLETKHNGLIHRYETPISVTMLFLYLNQLK